MITILVCTAAGLLCVALGWAVGRACLKRESGRKLEHEYHYGYNCGYTDGYRKAELRFEQRDTADAQ